MTVGQRIRALRKKKGLTQEQLGRRCGLTGAMLSGYERGGTLPKEKTLRALAEALDVPLSCLTDVPVLPEPILRDETDALFLEGLLEVLTETYGCAEQKVIGGENAVRYCLAGIPPKSFILYETDLLAVISSAKASIIPMAEGIRQRQAVPDALRKLG